MCIAVPIVNKVLIAEKDIVVYKFLCSGGKIWNKNIWRAPFMNFYYTIGELSSSVKDFELSVARFTLDVKLHEYTSPMLQENVVNLHEGLHSYAKIPEYHCITEHLLKAIIPKGSRYLHGTNNEVLSEHLIIIKELGTIGRWFHKRVKWRI